MAGEWRAARIEEVAEKVAMGPFGSSIKVDTFVPSGVPVISGQHLRGSKVDDGVGFNFVTVEHADRLKNANVRRGDVIFTHAGNIGQVAFVPESSQFERYVISQRQFYMRCDRKKVLPEFVVAYFKTREGQHQLLANTSQVGVPSIAQPVTYLRTVEIPLPPVPEQRAITHILGILDDKIELNRRMNETLEGILQALFQSWFVDFGPVPAKAEGRDTGLPKALADLFPSCLVDSELGEIPEGWNVGRLSDVASLLGGYAFKSTDWIERGVPVVKIGSVKAPLIDLNAVSYVSARVAEQASRFRLTPGDLLIGMTGYVGGVGLVPLTDSPPLLNQRVSKFLLNKPGTEALAFVYCLTRQPDFTAHVEAKSHGTAQANVSAEGILSIQLVAPPKRLQLEFDRIGQPILDRVLSSHAEATSLAALRDTLLPKLVSGELRVKQTEAAKLDDAIAANLLELGYGG